MIEKDIEKKICDYVTSVGGKAIKFEDKSMRGAPDRIVLLPSGKVLFIEFKRSECVAARVQQVYYHEKLMNLGFKVKVVGSVTEGIDFINEELGG
jgi:hypothetical protein